MHRKFIQKHQGIWKSRWIEGSEEPVENIELTISSDHEMVIKYRRYKGEISNLKWSENGMIVTGDWHQNNGLKGTCTLIFHRENTNHGSTVFSGAWSFHDDNNESYDWYGHKF